MTDTTGERDQTTRLGSIVAVGGAATALTAFAVFVVGGGTQPTPDDTRNIVDPVGLGAALSVTYAPTPPSDIDHPLEFIFSERFPSDRVRTPEQLGYPEAEHADDLTTWILGG